MRSLSVLSILLLAFAVASARCEEKLSSDLDAVKTAVEAGADINALDERKMPAIGAAGTSWGKQTSPITWLTRVPMSIAMMDTVLRR